MNASVLRRLEQLEAEAASLRPPPGERPGCWELLNWMTCDELIQIEQMLRNAGVDTVGELGVADQLRADALAATAAARRLDAPSEVRADPEAVAAYVREIEDRGRKRWL